MNLELGVRWLSQVGSLCRVLTCRGSLLLDKEGAGSVNSVNTDRAGLQ